jgi:hypothetical protein
MSIFKKICLALLSKGFLDNERVSVAVLSDVLNHQSSEQKG